MYLVDTLNPTKLPQVLDKVVNGSVSRTCAYGLQRISENQLVGSTWTPSFYLFEVVPVLAMGMSKASYWYGSVSACCVLQETHVAMAVVAVEAWRPSAAHKLVLADTL